MFFIVRMEPEQLSKIMMFRKEGTLRTIIDSIFPLEMAREASEYAAGGHAHGKVVLKVSQEQKQ